MAEMASTKYIQCVVDVETFKRLKVEAIHQDKHLGDLLREIVEGFVQQLPISKEENHG